MIRSATVTAAAALLAFLSTASATAPDDRAQLAEVLARVRHAVGAGGIGVLPPTAIVDRTADGRDATTFVDWRTGGFRIGEESGFDRGYRWQQDARRGSAVPLSLRQHEKAGWPVWVRDHWWLNPASGITASLLPGESTETLLALSLSCEDGVVPATLFIDRATMLPARLVVPYDRGPFEARYAGWRRYRGVAVAGIVDTHYRDAAHLGLVGIEPVAPARLAAPPPASDMTFDPATPARLAVRRGPDFGVGVRGHSFVRASIDGVEGWWLLDSGADGMLIDAGLADRLHLPVSGESRSVGADGRPVPATWRRGGSFRVGRLTWQAPLFRATDLSAASAPAGEHRAGVIGYDIFARAVIEYGRDGDEVAVCDPATYRTDAAVRWQPLDHIDQTPAVPARVEGRYTGLFQVDTGAAGAVDFYKPFVDAHHLLDDRATTEVQSSGSGGGFTMRAGRIASIDFAGRRFVDQEVGFRMTAGRDGAGVIGRALLAPFLTVFDYRRHRIAFRPATRRDPIAARCR